MFRNFKVFTHFKIPLVFFATGILLLIPISALRYSATLADMSELAILGASAAIGAIALWCHMRQHAFVGVVLGTVVATFIAAHLMPGDWLWIPLTTVISFVIQGALADSLQEKHSLQRSFPFFAHLRQFFELIRDEIRQYLIEDDTEGKPASRDDRSFVYQAAKNELNDISFGTKRDYHKPGQIHIPNSAFPIPDREPIELAPIVLGPNRRVPAILHGRFGIGDMSFGSLGANAVQSLSSGAKFGLKFMEKPNGPKKPGLICTGEGSLTEYHRNGVHIKPTTAQKFAWAGAFAMSHFSDKYRREPFPIEEDLGSGQIMLEAGTGKFGLRTEDGAFDWALYGDIMQDPNIVATKIKIAQGAKPGGGGILPAEKITPEIAKIRRIRMGEDCLSPNAWDEFHDVESMMAFIAQMQEVSGKPVGIKIVVGQKKFIVDIAEWMAAHPGEGPDFIHVDGGEGGTGAAPLMLADFVGMSIMNALPLLDNVLREHGVRDRVVLMSSGKVFNPAQLFIHLALGADYVLGARGFMFSLGCIQAAKCATGECPVGVTTHHPWLQRALVPRIKYVRVANYMQAMHKQLIKLLRVAGVRDTFELNRSHLMFVKDREEVDGRLVYPYPSGHDAPRTPPVPADYVRPEYVRPTQRQAVHV